MSEKSAMGMIIDSPLEELDKYFKEQNYNLTDLKNIKKALEMEYQRVTLMKDDVLKKLQEKMKRKKRQEFETLFNNLYVILQRIEEKATFIQTIITERSNLSYQPQDVSH
jgi:glycerol-3-phosphate responsive antiterminator